MKTSFLSLCAAFGLVSISPVHATMIYYGIFSGTVTSTTGWVAPYPVGTPVTGTFSYDYDLLSPPDSEGLRWTGHTDPKTIFNVNIDGRPFASYYNTLNLEALGFSVDANGLPVSGGFYSTYRWSLDIGSGGALYLSWIQTISDPQLIGAHVTYTISSVPEAAATSFLLGIALAGIGAAKRLMR